MSIVAKTAAMFQPRTSRRKIGPIGIDFGLEAVHLVQLAESDGKSPELRAATSVPYNSSRREVLENAHQFRSLLKRALAADRFYGRKSVIAVPSGMFRTISINYQSSGGKDQEGAAILRVMKDRLDGELSDYVIDYLPVNNRSKSDERLALVAVSEHDRIVNFLELARKARLDVDALEIGPVAISRLVGALSQETGSSNVLVINSGRRASYLTVISGTDLLFDQEVSFGEDSLIQQAAETLDLSNEMARDLILRSGVASAAYDESVAVAIDEAGLMSTISEILKPQFIKLVEEIKRVCLYAASETRGGAVTQVYLLGSIARWPGSDALLSTMTGVEVVKMSDPLAPFQLSDQRGTSPENSSSADLVVATGVALRGMQSNG